MNFPPDESPSDAGSALARFEAERRRLFVIAYRLLGSVSDAEDVLQDAYIKWQAQRHDTIGNPGAWLATVVTRLALDALDRAHRRRVEYVGPWLPEPMIQETDAMPHAERPDEVQELGEELSLAFLVMLERLSPAERAVFVLRESFDFDYREIARILGKSEENCRQIDRRARRHLAGGARVRAGDPGEHRELVERFLRATRDGDVDGLLAVLAKDVVSYADGGGKVFAAKIPVEGAERVARYLAGLRAKAPPGVSLRIGRVNGEPAILTYVDGVLHNVIALYVEDGAIRRLFIVVNPDKLHVVA